MNSSNTSEFRRPLLSGGERLQETIERASGGGSKYHPYSPEEAHQLLLPKVLELRESLESLAVEQRAEHLVFEATLYPNYLAASHFPQDLLTKFGLYMVGSKYAEAPKKTKKETKPAQSTKSLLLAGNDQSIFQFVDAVVSGPAQGGPEWNRIRQFYDFRTPDPQTTVRRLPVGNGKGEFITWEAVLNPIGRSQAEADRMLPVAFERWQHWVESLGGDVDMPYRRIIDGVTFVPISLNQEEIYHAAQFNLVRAIRPMPQIRPFPVGIARSSPSGDAAPAPPEDAEPEHSFRVAIFDGGLSTSSEAITKYATQTHLTPEPVERELVEHGSMVTSALLFGHLDGSPLSAPKVGPIDHYRVLPPPKDASGFNHDLYWLLDEIADVVANENPLIVNLSLGPDEVADSDGEPSRWTSELDRLAVEHNVLFMCAVGNNGKEDGDLGFNRIQIPGDMVNGMGIGACTKYRCSQQELHRAPYSAVGPGRPGQRVQPTAVMFGGSEEEPFRAIGARGTISQGLGTSFATPIASRSVINLAAILTDEHRRADLLRTFAIHFTIPKKRSHRLAELGYGLLPESYLGRFECSPNECTVLYSTILKRDEIYALRIPFPIGIPDATQVTMDWTIGYFSDVDPKESTEYTLSGLEVACRPHERLRKLTYGNSKKTEEVHLDDDHERIQQLLATGNAQLSTHPPSRPRQNWQVSRNEEERRRLSGKWETIIRGSLKLRAEEIFDPRIDIAYLKRETGMLQRADVPPLNVTMIATIRAMDNTPLYDMVRSRYQILTPIQIQVPASPTL